MVAANSSGRSRQRRDSHRHGNVQDSSEVRHAKHTKPIMPCAAHVMLDWIPAFAGMTNKGFWRLNSLSFEH